MRFALCSALLVITSSQASTQTPLAAPAAEPRFEVVSVKPTGPDATVSFISGPTPSRFQAQNVTLARIILYGFGLRDYQLVGGPNWIRSERFDLVGTYPNSAAQSEVSQMVQSAVVERFKLRTHKETRDGPTYALVLARADGRLGPKLRKSEADCATLTAARKGEAVSFGGAPGEKLPPCMGAQRPEGNDTVYIGNNRTMTQLANVLSRAADRPVADRTGLSGEFDVELRWTSALEPTSATDNAESLFTALGQQLGLKLESTRGPVEVLVIDSVERPTPD